MRFTGGRRFEVCDSYFWIYTWHHIPVSVVKDKDGRPKSYRHLGGTKKERSIPMD
uniref:Uncharacterized protein n=1 Tax=viral metagenome TaxID=1070528 RepID=A0A6M3IR69_9ZZZZ